MEASGLQVRECTEPLSMLGMITFDAKTREERVSGACAGEGDRLAIISALASPPSESCSSMVNLEFLPTRTTGVLRAGPEKAQLRCAVYAVLQQRRPTEAIRDRSLLPVACLGSTCVSAALAPR